MDHSLLAALALTIDMLSKSRTGLVVMVKRVRTQGS